MKIANQTAHNWITIRGYTQLLGVIIDYERQLSDERPTEWPNIHRVDATTIKKLTQEGDPSQSKEMTGTIDTITEVLWQVKGMDTYMTHLNPFNLLTVQ